MQSFNFPYLHVIIVFFIIINFFVILALFRVDLPIIGGVQDDEFNCFLGFVQFLKEF